MLILAPRDSSQVLLLTCKLDQLLLWFGAETTLLPLDAKCWELPTHVTLLQEPSVETSRSILAATSATDLTPWTLLSTRLDCGFQKDSTSTPCATRNSSMRNKQITSSSSTRPPRRVERAVSPILLTTHQVNRNKNECHAETPVLRPGRRRRQSSKCVWHLLNFIPWFNFQSSSGT
mmetsp:Transcript_327/g.728  ORF Transcript_327/g.728 Transcript_327/m.728 type:complete len:176 (-) Transcript_327:1279-1806(-)